MGERIANNNHGIFLAKHGKEIRIALPEKAMPGPARVQIFRSSTIDGSQEERQG